MNRHRHVRLFRNGRNQAVRIPRDLELPGDEAILRKEGDRLILEPAPPHSLLQVLDTLEPIEERFPEIGDPPPGREFTRVKDLHVEDWLE
ncbi:AbrB/MazE/SpoVT family DNA-binding domain-containing protein [Thiohalocapsa marina]|uniref:AbrB/MazE/SpoVT family DNA-binding domain-containing protein n=1 Tax=Thiohalocapsa marina TaxID=424902 RepID=A0A5M8FKB8_9GAMM|nr:AbrB/MazE/SpoVT family DNA-binding domain-containing protein [Thiohalocapsa marina]KAA6185363.1 AbrB/MazE/SpoVT family DNA-binding domain-containing protein [Thiohalocapsa marina]